MHLHLKTIGVIFHYLRCFVLIAKASTLRLNIPKCKVLLVWSFSVDNCKRLLQDCCPSLYDMVIVVGAFYFRFPVGVHVALHAWDKPLAKLTICVNVIRSAGTGFAGADFL